MGGGGGGVSDTRLSLIPLHLGECVLGGKIPFWGFNDRSRSRSRRSRSRVSHEERRQLNNVLVSA